MCFSGKSEVATIQLSRGKSLLLESGPISQVHKNKFPRSFRAVKEERSGESVL